MFQDCKDMKSSKRFCFYLFNFCTLIYFGQKFTQNSDFLKFAGQNLDLDKISRIFNKFRNVSLNHSDLTRENVTFTERKMCRKEKSVERRKSACVAFTTRANDWISLSNVAAVLACWVWSARDLYRMMIYMCACVCCIGAFALTSSSYIHRCMCLWACVLVVLWQWLEY